jgi:translation elongation factor EF-1alpha
MAITPSLLFYPPTVVFVKVISASSLFSLPLPMCAQAGTYQYLRLAKSLNMSKVIVAVNKMDCYGVLYHEGRFNVCIPSPLSLSARATAQIHVDHHVVMNASHAGDQGRSFAVGQGLRLE